MNLGDVSLVTLWLVVALNLALTLRLSRWFRRRAESNHAHVDQPDLVIGARAPKFSVNRLGGGVRTLDSYGGRRVLFAFVSPSCGTCGRAIPRLQRMSSIVRSHDVSIVLVSDSAEGRTRSWLAELSDRAGYELELDVLLAPRLKSRFIQQFNPRGLFPFFCLLTGDGTVQERDILGYGSWESLVREWGCADILPAYSARVQAAEREHDPV